MKLPEFTTLKQVNQAHLSIVEVSMQLTDDMLMFDGHFSGRAIMPAVAQLYIVQKLAEQFAVLQGVFIGLKQVKFKGPICPDTVVNIVIHFDRKKQLLSFEYLEHGSIKSQGQLRYGDSG